MSATVHLTNGTSIVLDAIQGDARGQITKGVLLSIEGHRAGQVTNCVIVPAGNVRALIASLELVASQLKA